MTDIVDRLTAEWPDVKDAQDGAKEIIKLREKVEKLTEVLKPFVDRIDLLNECKNAAKYAVSTDINVEHLRRAKEVYENTK